MSPDGPTPPRLIIFDDQRGRFGPLTRLRAAFSIRTGATCNRVRIELSLGIMAADLVVADALAKLYRAHQPDVAINQPAMRDGEATFHIKTEKDPKWRPVHAPGDATVLLVNGRWPGDDPHTAAHIRQLMPGQSIATPDGSLLAAHLTCADAQHTIDQRFCAPADAIRLEKDILITRPWHIIDRLEHALTHDLTHWPQSQPHVAHDAHLHPAAVLDETLGPVVIDHHAVVGPLAVIQGPAYVGERAQVRPQTLIRPHTAIGPVCNVAGEINHCVFESHSNKAHSGYLGHGLIGQWVNLGADTNASNLKNTLGPIRVQLDADHDPEDTGRQFLGPIIGDYTRTAIGTRVNTGSVLDVGVMYAATAFTPKYTPPFRFITDAGDAAHDIDKLLTSTRALMQRRGLQPDAATETHLRALAGERR